MDDAFVDQSGKTYYAHIPNYRQPIKNIPTNWRTQAAKLTTQYSRDRVDSPEWFSMKTGNIQSAWKIYKNKEKPHEMHIDS